MTRLTPIFMLLVATSGCSVVMAAKQPDAKDLSVLNEGTPRSAVVSELGPPVWSGEREGAKVEVFSFVDGYHKGTKAARAFFHAAADVFTFGLWEVVGTPAEAIFSGSKMRIEVVYDAQERVKSTRDLSKEGPAADAEGAQARR
jgi:hypothetical protein